MKVEFIKENKNEQLIDIKKISSVAILFTEKHNFPDEVVLLDNHRIFTTGYGKINATIKLMDVIHNFNPELIINFGASGSVKLPIGEIYQCESFIQKDMNATSLGFQKYITPFDEDNSEILTYKCLQTNLKRAVCGTGDFFSTSDKFTDLWDLSDMEGYALAKVSKKYNIPFLSIKCVTNKSNEDEGAEKHSSFVHHDSFSIKFYQIYKDLFNIK